MDVRAGASASIDEALTAAGVTAGTLSSAQREALDRDGYAVFRSAIPAEWIAPLRETFERFDTPSERWPAPREYGTRHAMLDGDPDVRRACLLPVTLASVFHYLRERFYLAAVEGRDPQLNRGQQELHRDWAFPDAPCQLVKALGFLDDYSAANGATRVIPGSHRERGDGSAFQQYGQTNSREIVLEGDAGDIFLFHGRLAHSGTPNLSGAKRRALQMWFRGHELFDAEKDTRDVSRCTLLERYLLGHGL
jgi:ectoine hydroxylase-related dioxygenase (phytanoyl-CoA dioxygenase family)